MIQGHRSMPILSVKNVEASIDYYVGQLGFSKAGQWNNDDGSANFAIVFLDQITIGLQSNSKASGSGENWAAYFYIEDINAFADQVEGNGVKLSREIQDQFYGCRDLEITDIDDNRLCFGQDLSPGGAGPGL